MMAIHSVGIISKPRKQDLEPIVPGLLEWLQRKGISAILDRETASALESGSGKAPGVSVVARSELGGKCDLVIVLGGDGTLLAAARNVHAHNVPLLAVNLGSLGFLTAVAIEELYDSLELVLAGQHRIDCRKMLQIQLLRSGSSVGVYHALNDAVLNKGAISRMLDFEAYVDGQFLTLFKADGLIVSTPTGSTAYSLSAGGPIIYPSVEAFLVTPICPHTLTHRPLVVPDNSQIEIVLKTEAESVFLTVDGQIGLALHQNDRVVCSLSSSRVNLVSPPRKEFFEVLRKKLKWGER
ncbi:MAG: NAD(+)/NADH kinase [Acidobacteria bacterium]|nr:NAD(+)/NADH kinase [Acidobacteriota bacterium]